LPEIVPKKHTLETCGNPGAFRPTPAAKEQPSWRITPLHFSRTRHSGSPSPAQNRMQLPHLNPIKISNYRTQNMMYVMYYQQDTDKNRDLLPPHLLFYLLFFAFQRSNLRRNSYSGRLRSLSHGRHVVQIYFRDGRSLRSTAQRN
jgi:hypothetical protein